MRFDRDDLHLIDGLQHSDHELTPILLAEEIAHRRGRTMRGGGIEVKAKYRSDDLSRAFLWSDFRQEYVPLPCTRPRYAAGLSRWMHERIRAYAHAKALAFNTEGERLEARACLVEMIRSIANVATDAERRLGQRILGSFQVRQIVTAAFAAMANRTLPYTLAPAGSSLTRRIRVAARDVNVVSALASPPLTYEGLSDRMLTREDALNVLNLSAPRYRDLAPFEHERTDGSARILSAAEIVAVAGVVISGSEIQARFGVMPHDAARLLRRAEVARRHNLGWLRDAAVAAIAEHHRSQWVSASATSVTGGKSAGLDVQTRRIDAVRFCS